MSLGDTLTRLTLVLERARLETPRLDARILIAAAVNKEPQDILLHEELELSPEQSRRLDMLITRRCAGEPISRILGEREFWGLRFRLSPNTLDPRPDSETLISTILSITKDDKVKPRQILDVGTGTGCLLLSLLNEWPNSNGIGLDIDFGAVRTACFNAEQLGMRDRSQFLVGDWLSSLECRFDVIVANPPYISTTIINELAPEVRFHDPKKALDGGFDGLVAYRQLIPQCSKYLASNGLLVLEVGATQGKQVVELLFAAGLVRIRAHNDLAGHVRCITCYAR